MNSPAIAAAGSLSPTSPVSLRSAAHAGRGQKRKRSNAGNTSTVDSSPGSVGDDHDADHAEKKRQPGVKRACNECRQQKLRCNVVQDPFQSCTRCKRLQLECKIESNFKRVGKRSKHAEMEKEIERLRHAVDFAKHQGFSVPDVEDNMQAHLKSPMVGNGHYSHARNPSLMGPDEAVSSLLTLSRGGRFQGLPRIVRKLDEFELSGDLESSLFKEYFCHYHNYLPLLKPNQSAAEYYSQHPLLYWAIVSVACRRHGAQSLLQRLAPPLHRLLWATIGDVPQSYFIIKALCLLCTWPMPTRTTTEDPTHILCGVMMKAATGIGLHRPLHLSDFSRTQVEVQADGLRDRVTTWAVCNIVAQSIGTGYGQPASTLYDWTLATRPGASIGDPFSLCAELEARLEIERFCDKVSKGMYSNASDSRGVAGDEHRAMLMRVFLRDYREMKASMESTSPSPIVKLHLKAAALHLRLATFFDSSSTPGYMDNLMGLWLAICGFLDYILDQDEHCPLEMRDGYLVKYATNFIQQTLVAAGFAVYRLMRSFFVHDIDLERGRRLFHRTIEAIRESSVTQTTLYWKMAELMVQIWNGSRLDHPSPFQLKCEANDHESGNLPPIDDTLQLKVRCRHSMSLVHDGLWLWREEYQSRGRSTLESLVKQQTNPDSANESSASPVTHLDTNALVAQPDLSYGSNPLQNSGRLTPNPSFPISIYEQQDSWESHWMLDGIVDFNLNNLLPLESA